MTKTICDRCEGEQDVRAVLFQINAVGEPPTICCDLCHYCIQSMKDFLKPLPRATEGSGSAHSRVR